MAINVHAGWIAILLGLLLGAAIGLFFYRDDWLGGYGSWRRRMLRLAHVSLVATGLLNVAAGLTQFAYCAERALPAASLLLIAGTVTMPAVCLLSAWRQWVRHLFFVPVLCLILGVLDLVFRGLL